MRALKDRLTVTIDPAIVRAGNAAVARGEAPSLSAWVNAALTERVDKERRLAGMAEAVAAYEAKYGKITDEDVAAQERADRRNAIRFKRRSPAVERKRRRRAA